MYFRTEVNQTVNVTYSLQPHTMIEANKETKIFTLLAWEHLVYNIEGIQQIVY